MLFENFDQFVLNRRLLKSVQRLWTQIRGHLYFVTNLLSNKIQTLAEETFSIGWDNKTSYLSFWWFFFIPLSLVSQILYWKFACQFAEISYLLNLVIYMTCNLVLTTMNVLCSPEHFTFWDTRFYHFSDDGLYKGLFILILWSSDILYIKYLWMEMDFLNLNEV